MTKDAGDLDELEEFDELEDVAPLEELAELEELEELPPAPAPAPDPAPAPAPRAGPRELERAPLMLQKAALVLTVAALFPWLVPSVDGAFPLQRTLAKLVVLLGGYVLYMGVKHRHGEAVPGAFAKLGGAHPRATTGVAALVMLIGLAPLVDPGGDWFRSVIAKAALAVGMVVWCQVQDYAKGGKFNPLFGLVIPMFGVGGLARLITVFADKPFDFLALIGSVGVTVAGVLAGYTMVVAIKEAKEHGKAKKQAAMEARKRQRKAKSNR